MTFLIILCPHWEPRTNSMEGWRGTVNVHYRRRTMDPMNKRKNIRALKIIAAAAFSFTILGAGATYAFAGDSRGVRNVAGTIYSDVGTTYGAYDFSGSREEELPLWDGNLS
ncbi:hypothetical protein [Corynebacterium sp. HMSC074C01]|uniref:hypothetical protein n=2 Tax=Corynebacterium TaxID=1716 RepID=UPI001177C81D|nr:hypothetical protein [Corynebacterium sp. HMSC074C01]